MNRIPLLILMIMLGPVLNAGSQNPASTPFRIVFYNVENLFDTIDDPQKIDNDFLPSSKVAWTSARMIQKLDQTARVIRAIDSTNLPAIVGMAEIENREMLLQLVARPALAEGHYRVILEEGEDPRGIDVAMILRDDVVQYLTHRAFPSSTLHKTRNILYVKVKDIHDDTLHLFVNHWKSRSGGKEETENQRLENAAAMRHLADSIISDNPRANLVIMGDFNDEPGDKSISEILGAKEPVKKPTANMLYNLHYAPFKTGEGTLYYKDWDLFDQIIVSGSMLGKQRNRSALIKSPYAYIFKQQWMLYRNKSGEMVPNRTASGKEYFGGYSDHLPVYTIIN
jgi:endonuclease/exonuclease/phosphatase family metal-dependent hydrolase